MLLELFGSLGDEIAITGAVRAVRQTFPNERIAVNCRRPWIFENNPHLIGGTEDLSGKIVLPLGGHPDYHMVDSYLIECGIEPEEQYRTPELFLTEKELAVGDLVHETSIAIDTWAGWPSRRWPFEKWQAVVSALREEYPIIEIGASTPDCFGRQRTQLLADVDACFVDALSVRQTAGLIAKCGLYLGNDSGMMHVAAAVGTRSVVVFGPKDCELREYENTFPVSANRGCWCEEVCMQRSTPCPIDVPVEQVLREVRRVYQGNKL